MLQSFKSEVSFVTNKEFWSHSMLAVPITVFRNVSSVIKKKESNDNIKSLRLFVCNRISWKKQNKKKKNRAFWHMTSCPKIYWSIKRKIILMSMQLLNKIIFFICFNFSDKAWPFLSPWIFGLFSSSSLLYSQCFDRCVLRPYSGVSCQTREPTHNLELIPLFNPQG